MNHYSYLVSFAVAFLATLALTWPVRAFALRIGMVDKPGPRKVHVKPMPLLGGIAIYLGFVLAILLTVRGVSLQISGVLVGATLLAGVGMLDDGGLLHHQVKLFVGMPVAALLLLATGTRAQLFSDFIPGEIGVLFDGLFTIFWVVGITASFSILDHMDGLCAGIAAVGAAFFAMAAIFNGQVLVATLAAASLGAALGFLRWNFNPAKIFMGDGGAMMLGFLMATLGLKIRPSDAGSPASWVVPVLILGVPIFDTTLVTISRARRGLLPFTSPGKDHTAHRLSNLGLGCRGAVLSLYLLAAFSGSVGLLVNYVPPGIAFVLMATLVFLGLIAVLLLEGVPYERQAKLPKAFPVP
jgi:UDP-GlcNAc:undecaprenyl-phosphate GlcNAc-1-phosphate transferase